ncbi:MAG: RnfABCDGE type electron transport complex subunit D [Clostridium sp.]|nr:RnfABCDGE type electron transport complex subunit D [Clostridium sp.]
MEKRNLKVSPAPFIKRGLEIDKIMIDFIISLMPIIIASIYFYKFDALKIIIVTVMTSVISEGLWNKYVKKTSFFNDLSPIVLGIIISLIMPTYVPLWIPVVATLFATIIVKQFFGGFGQNFMNPAAAAKAFLIASWAGVMAKPVTDATTSASSTTEVTVSLLDKIIGQASGTIGEVSILALCIGGLYLVIRKRISLRGPIAFILSAMAMYSYFGKELLLPGSFFIAAIFMTTDYGTTPMTRVGQYIFGILAGICASLIVVKGYNSEGAYYAIIIMNLCTPLIDYLATKKFKVEKEG